MATKLNPGTFDCYAKALPDEPMFILLARDPDFEHIVTQWALRRKMAIDEGRKPPGDMAMVNEAMECARAGEAWRKENDGRWRQPPHRFEPLPLKEGETK